MARVWKRRFDMSERIQSGKAWYQEQKITSGFGKSERKQSQPHDGCESITKRTYPCTCGTGAPACGLVLIFQLLHSRGRLCHSCMVATRANNNRFCLCYTPLQNAHGA